MASFPTDPSAGAVADDVASPTTAGATGEATTTTDGTDAAGDTADGAAAGSTETSGPVTATPAPVVGQVTEDNPDGALRYAVIEDKQIFLRGSVPNQEVADAIVALNLELWGEGNVFDEHTIDPSVPENVPVSIYITNVVLFEFNSIELDPQFNWLLDVGALFLVNNPNMTMTVIGHADSIGSEEVNLRVAGQRANVVRDYYIAKGALPEQVFAEAKGEADAAADELADPGQRRVKFVVNGNPTG
ncbi:MAG: OmpA family protein [Acidimicrobiales bacterium]